MANITSVIDPVPTLKRRSAKNPRSSIGWSVWRSQAMKAPSTAAAAASPPRVTASVQPWCGASMSVQTSAVRPTIDSAGADEVEAGLLGIA